MPKYCFTLFPTGVCSKLASTGYLDKLFEVEVLRRGLLGTQSDPVTVEKINFQYSFIYIYKLA
jgi:hypothetical protein